MEYYRTLDPNVALIFACFMMVLALLLFNSFYQRKGVEEEAVLHAIENSYQLFHKLSLTIQEHWGLSHLSIVSIDSYKETRNIINAMIQKRIKKAPEERLQFLSECRHRERNMIINLLIFYEQIYYLSKHSGNKLMRKRFLRLLNRYFTERLLLNPRIVYFVLKNADGTDLHIEEESYNYLIIKYKHYLKKDLEKKKANSIKIDAHGPIRMVTSKDPSNTGFFSIETEKQLMMYIEDPKNYWRTQLKSLA